jgi:hypothetical protein
MEIDLTNEVSAQPVRGPHDKYRRRIVTAAALVVGLVVGSVVGATLGERGARDGPVLLAGADLAGSSQAVELRWSLANFSSAPARVGSVLVNGKPTAIDSPEIGGKSIAEFTTPLQCGEPDPPQFTITVADGDEESQELGYLVDKTDWERLCR